jgi:protein TonB
MLLFITTSSLCISQEIEVTEIELSEVEASFPGGSAAMKKFIQNEVKYSMKFIEFSESGKVYLAFIVERDGSISNIKVVRGVSTILDTQAIGIIRRMPYWNPGKRQNVEIRTHCRLPIAFTIDKHSDDYKKFKKSQRKRSRR